MVTKCAPVRRQASHADQAGARERACTIATRSARISAASRAALRQIVSGFRLVSGSVMWRPPARSHRGHQPAAGAGHQARSTGLGDRLGDLDRAALDAAGDQRRQHLQHGDVARVSLHD